MDEEAWFNVVCLVAAIVVLVGIGSCAVNEVRWSETPISEIPCHLLSQNYAASTLRTQAVPVFTGKGMAMAFTTTGDPEKKTTIWDCGDLGRLTTDNEDVFRWAKEDSIIKIKIRGNSF